MNGSVRRPAAATVASWRSFLPLALVAALGVAAFAFGLHEYLSFETLRQNRQAFLAWVEEYPVLCAAGFVLLYVAIVTIGVPAATVLTISGGFMFGQLIGAALAVVAATTGSGLIFLLAKTTVGEWLRAKAGPWLRRMQEGFARNAFSYLLVLRLVPIFPFFVVNIVPAFMGVGLSTFLLATFLGIIPGSFVYASVGAGLGSVFDSGEAFSPGSVLTPPVITALLGLALLALLPVAYRWWMRARAASDRN